MGIGFDFGPARADLRRPRGGERWFSERRLDAEQMRELVRAIESWGGEVAEHSDGSLSIAGEHEEFVVQPSGGYLSKPNVGGEDEYDRLWQLLTAICDWAGWIVVGGDGLVFGAHWACERCGEVGERCPNRHGVEHLRMVLEVSPPAEAAARPAEKLDAVREAKTARELRTALSALGAPPPYDDPDIVTALLQSDDDDVLAAALEAADRLAAGSRLRRSALLDTRLRSIEMLSDDPSLAARAKGLRARLR